MPPALRLVLSERGASTPEPRVRLVVAANRRDFELYCREAGVNPSKRLTRYIGHPREALGWDHVDVVYVQGWAGHRDWREIDLTVRDIHDAKISHWSPARR